MIERLLARVLEEEEKKIKKKKNKEKKEEKKEINALLSPKPNFFVYNKISRQTNFLKMKEDPHDVNDNFALRINYDILDKTVSNNNAFKSKPIIRKHNYKLNKRDTLDVSDYDIDSKDKYLFFR